jgi:two-component system chemotaxis sensor kinase CheA
MIDIETEPGEGSMFTLTLPITLAIIKALIVQAGEQVFAVPLSSVLEIIQATEGQIETVETREVINIRNETVPLLRLQQTFNLPAREKGDALFLIIVGLAERRMGIVVDSLRDQQEIVIKPLGKRLANLPGIAGATELGDRRGVVLVLDVESLMEGTLKKSVAATIR